MADPLADLPGGDTKIAGHSIYLYGASLAAVAVVYMWWTRRGQSQEAANTFAPDTSVPDVTGDLGDLPVSTTGDNQDLEVAGPTNAEWEVKSIAYLATRGVSPLTAQQAIENYFDGETLTYDQGVAINAAVGQYGPPPEGLSGTPTFASSAPVIHWTAKRENWTTVGRAPIYRTVGAAPYRSSSPNANFGSYSTATINGVRYVRTRSGLIYSTNDIRPQSKK